jgi:propanediol utilization protein
VSGDLNDTPGILVEGPRGQIALAAGVIAARRHIHMNPEDAHRLGVHVRAKLGRAGRSAIFDEIAVRVAPSFTLELHLDTDEANAAGVASGDVPQLMAAVVMA